MNRPEVKRIPLGVEAVLYQEVAMPIFTKAVPNTDYVSLRDSFMSSLSADEYFALEAYTSSSFKEINASLIGGDPSGGHYAPVIATIQTALKKQKEETLPILFRGTLQEFVSDMVEGQEVSFPFFLSASTDPLVADRFSGKDAPAVIVIKNLNRNYAPVSVSQLNEYEVLISPEARFKVEKITHGADFQAEYDQSGFHAPIKKNVTVVEISAI